MANAQSVKSEIARRGDDTPTPHADPVFDTIGRQIPALRSLLGDEETARRYARIAVNEVRKTPRLTECSPESVIGALMLSAQYQLEPGPAQHVYLIPRKNRGRLEAQWMLGYRGMVELASRAGVQVVADVICENDRFRRTRTATHDDFEHEPALGARGDIIGAYAVARYPKVDGRPPLVEVIDMDVIYDARERSDAWQAKGDQSPWGTDFPSMCRKTAVRRLHKWIGGTSVLASAVDADGRIVYGAAGSAEVQVSAVDDRPEPLPPGPPLDVAGAMRAHDAEHQTMDVAAERAALDQGDTDPDNEGDGDGGEPLGSLTNKQYEDLRAMGVDEDTRADLARLVTGHRHSGPVTSTRALTAGERNQLMRAASHINQGDVNLAHDGDTGTPRLVTVDGEVVDVTELG